LTGSTVFVENAVLFYAASLDLLSGLLHVRSVSVRVYAADDRQMSDPRSR
jgi:hypothetical protein